MKESQILAIIKEPGKPYRVELAFDNTLEAFQKAVGGLIDCVTICDDVVMVCNAESTMRNLPHNFTYSYPRNDFSLFTGDICGTVVFACVRGADFASLSPSGMRVLTDMVLSEFTWG